MKSLAVDPGKRTGWCYGYLDGSAWHIEPGEEELSLSAMYAKLSLFIVRGGNHVIYEDFRYRNYARTGLDLTPVKVIGIIELFREWHEPFVTFTKQSAATGKAFYTDDKLKELGVYWPHGKGHARDATRHMLQWANFGAGGEYMDMQTVSMSLIDTMVR